MFQGSKGNTGNNVVYMGQRLAGRPKVFVFAKTLADMGVGEEIFIKVCVVVSKIITWNAAAFPENMFIIA